MWAKVYETMKHITFTTLLIVCLLMAMPVMAQSVYSDPVGGAHTRMAVNDEVPADDAVIEEAPAEGAPVAEDA